MISAFMLAVLVSVPAAAQKAPVKKLSRQEAALHAAAKVSEDSARAIAIAAVPGGTVKEGELEKEKGKLIWSFDLKVAGKKGVEEVWVDAITGKVINREHESDAAETKEAAAGAKLKGTKPAVAKPVRKP
jgi:hypothetical protein